MESGPLFHTEERTVKGIDTQECSEVCVCAWAGALCMSAPALIWTIVFILCNLADLQCDEFKLPTCVL